MIVCKKYPLILIIYVTFLSSIESDSKVYNKMELISRALRFNSKLNKSVNSTETVSRQIRQSSNKK